MPVLTPLHEDTFRIWIVGSPVTGFAMSTNACTNPTTSTAVVAGGDPGTEWYTGIVTTGTARRNLRPNRNAVVRTPRIDRKRKTAGN